MKRKIKEVSFWTNTESNDLLIIKRTSFKYDALKEERTYISSPGVTPIIRSSCPEGELINHLQPRWEHIKKLISKSSDTVKTIIFISHDEIFTVKKEGTPYKNLKTLVREKNPLI